MSPRKRARPNPCSEESTTSLPATLSSQAGSVSSQVSNASPALPAAPVGREMRPPTRTDLDASNTTPAARASNGNQVRKSRSWYGSLAQKSSASTQVAREHIMGGTLRSRVAPDFSRYDTSKGEGSAESDTQSIKTLPKISESEAQHRPHDGKPDGAKPDDGASSTKNPEESAQADRTRGDLALKDQTKDVTTPSNGETDISPEEAQRPTSSGWLSWFGRPPLPETSPATGDKSDIDPPKESQPIQPEPQQDPPAETQVPPETPKPAQTPTSWFGLWSTSASATAPEDTAPAATAGPDSLSAVAKETQDVVMEGAATPAPPAAASTQPSAGSTWAFWSRDTGSNETVKSGEAPEQGELAVIGDGSEASPRRSSGVQAHEAAPSLKGSPVKAAKESLTKASSSLRHKRVRPRSMDIDEPSSARPNSPQSDSSIKTAPAKPTTPVSIKGPSQNLLLPSFHSTYRLKENPSIIKQITQLLLRTQQPSANHVNLSKEPPRIKKAIAIGVHGLFPASYLRAMIGQPTGTSIRFANHAAEAIRKWAEKHGSSDCEIEKVALEGEGKIADRVDNLWKLLLNWIEHIRSADLIVLACHSQGVPVGFMLLAKLIDLGIITNARIGVCAMAGVSLGPFPDYKSSVGMIMGTAAELWQFADPESEITKRYEHALQVVVNYGARVTYIGSIDDQLVPMESAIYSPASHPYIYRAVFIDGRIHAPDFIAHLVGFALKLRNLGISDHGLIRELSIPLAGSLYGGEGHSRLYDDEQVYEWVPSQKAPFLVGNVANYSKPGDLTRSGDDQGLLEEDFVKTELHSETTELLKQFDDWTPNTKALKDVKYRLEAVRSKL
ncbi:Uu.00g081320.m01.CDS01 [Anthostomella pinea]|uniref:Uu.00g081320.m01.CDS01 n=1 Tax=Anthostomella pinea TaxID=933095 RepID=A0AAI8YJA4_9PEZI|nr:Uu.00g081320.m01.CDS01 [Anthostomella pinea]